MIVNETTPLLPEKKESHNSNLISYILLFFGYSLLTISQLYLLFTQNIKYSFIGVLLSCGSILLLFNYLRQGDYLQACFMGLWLNIGLLCLYIACNSD